MLAKSYKIPLGTTAHARSSDSRPLRPRRKRKLSDATHRLLRRVHLRGPKRTTKGNSMKYKSTHQIIVMLRTLAAIDVSDGDDTQVQARIVPVVVPAHSLESNSEKYIRRALRKWRPGSRKEHLAGSRRKLLVEIRESDAATANHTVVNDEHMTAVDWNWIMAVHQNCLIHQLYLVVFLILKVLSNGAATCPLVSTLYCTSKLLRQPSYWDSLLTAIPRVVRHCIRIKRTEVCQPEWRRHSELVLRSNGWDTQPPACKELLTWLNGDWRVFGEINVYAANLGVSRISSVL